MDPEGKIVVVTGGTSGLGQAAAVDFAKRGAKVFVVGRDAARGEETRALARAAGADLDVILGDVSTRAGVKAVAKAILERTSKLDVLLNNAGGTFDKQSTTADGVETTIGVNTLGAYSLEKELHGALAAARGRVVNVVTGFLNSFPIDPDDFVQPKKYKGLTQYGRAKLASVMLTVEQAQRFAADGVTAVSVHPGVIMGTRFGGGQPKAVQVIVGPFMRMIGLGCTLEEAVRRFRVACFDDVPSGSYMAKGAPVALPKQASDAQMRARVVGLIEGLGA